VLVSELRLAKTSVDVAAVISSDVDYQFFSGHCFFHQGLVLIKLGYQLLINAPEINIKIYATPHKI